MALLVYDIQLAPDYVRRILGQELDGEFSSMTLFIYLEQFLRNITVTERLCCDMMFTESDLYSLQP